MDWKDQLEPVEINKRIKELQDEEGMKNKSLSMFIELLKNKDPNVRYQAVEALGDSGGSQVVEPLFNMLGDEDEIVRKSAATVLKRFNNKRVMNVLYDALEAKDKDVRLVAIEALGNISDLRALPYIRKALKDVTQEVRVKAKKTLELIGKQANYYYQNMENDNIYLEDLDLEERAIPQLIEGLKDEDVRIRSYAVLALGYIGHEKAVEPLIEVLKDEQYLRVKKEIVFALGRIGDRRAIKTLIKALEDTSKVVRLCAILVLGEIGDEKTTPHLIKILRQIVSMDSEKDLRDAARESVKKIREDKRY